MKILNNEKNLACFLKSFHERKITIVSAFASGTEDVINLLLEHRNQLNILVGTIGSFSSPHFLEYCKNKKDENISLFVDFRYEESLHWKLYLIEPETVIIGSANFTNIGLTLKRDTCILVEDKSLLENYKKELEIIKSSSDVINCNDVHFDAYLQVYKKKHRRMQFGRARTVQAISGAQWLAEEENQLIPIFIWDSKHSVETMEEADRLLRDDSPEGVGDVVRDFFTYDSNGADFPYSQGDLVLCVNNKGSYPDFYTFDKIISKDGRDYIYSYKRNRYPRPFILNHDIKRKIKDKIGYWYEQEMTELNRVEVQSVINSSKRV